MMDVEPNRALAEEDLEVLKKANASSFSMGYWVQWFDSLKTDTGRSLLNSIEGEKYRHEEYANGCM